MNRKSLLSRKRRSEEERSPEDFDISQGEQDMPAPRFYLLMLVKKHPAWFN
jgi:hypothetical protein